MKVLHVGPKNYPPNHGGVEKVVFDLVREMPDVECHIFTEWVSPNGQSRVKKLSKNLLSAWMQVRRYAARNRIDIIHLHKETFIPLAILLELSGLRCVLTIHGCAWRLTRWSWYIRLMLFLLDCIGCCVLDRIAFVGEHDWRLFRKVIPLKRLYLVRNGVVICEESQSLKKEGMVYLGRLSPEKNILALVEAAEAAKIQLDLYGPFDSHDSEFRKTILNVLQNKHYANWKGAIPHEDAQLTLSRYRVFVNASFSEGLPVSVLEAAAEGLYLVLSDIPQHRLLKMPECRYVDPYALDLKGALPSCENVGSANREYVKQEFSIQRTVEAYYNIYKRLL